MKVDEVSLSSEPLYRRPISAARLTLNRWHQRKRYSRELRRLRTAGIVVVSYPKSGRTWLSVLISHLYHQQYGVDPSRLITSENFHRQHQAIPRVFFTHDQRPSPVHERRTMGYGQPLAPIEHFAEKKVLWLVRDPRDVAVSAYFHMTRRGRERQRLPVPIEPPAMFDFVLELELPQIIAFMQRWECNIRSVRDSMILRYEDLRARPAAELARVMRFIGAEFPPEMLEQAVAFASFSSLQRKEAGGFFASDRLHPGDSADPDSFKVRRGKVGGYRDYFTPDQLAKIEAMLADRLPDGLGYGQPAAGADRAEVLLP